MLAVSVLLTASCSEAFVQDPVDLVNPLMGTASDFRLSTGNTYPAIALPWGMNFWTPQTGAKGDGWQYTYGAHTIAGFKQTHQPSPWINDYGCFSVMPVRLQEGQTPEMMLAEDARRSFFSHQSETALPYFYRVYLADHDVSVEITPTERAAVMRLTFPESNASGFVIDSYGGELQIVDDRTIRGFTSYNHGGVPENFRNWFIIRSDKAFVLTASEEGHTAIVGFSTRRGEQVNLRMASSFISASQAEANLQEAGGSFDEVKSAAKARWNEVLGRIAIAGGTPEQQKTFYSCLYRCTLFPRKFYEISGGRQVHYSPYDGLVHDGPLYTDTGFWDTFRALLP
ncbi:MAG: GH92 family glycosyl hydrolase, partial [Bacteroidales bacterium]|nr:GH92 family glycosyl hydrolase [Bacteroidales bacterium]